MEGCAWAKRVVYLSANSEIIQSNLWLSTMIKYIVCITSPKNDMLKMDPAKLQQNY